MYGGKKEGSSVVSFLEADNVAINSWLPLNSDILCCLCDPSSPPCGNIKSEEQGLGALYSEARSQHVNKHGSVKEQCFSSAHGSGPGEAG